LFIGSVLGFPELTQEFIYFNRTDVQKAIHAPHVNWDICSDINVYGGTGRDQSTPSMLSVMPNVIEKSERVVVVHGLAVGSVSFLLRSAMLMLYSLRT
jgi:carboxypeptidase D